LRVEWEKEALNKTRRKGKIKKGKIRKDVVLKNRKNAPDGVDVPKVKR